MVVCLGGPKTKFYGPLARDKNVDFRLVLYTKKWNYVNMSLDVWKNDPEGPENGMFPMEIETHTKIIDFTHVL